MLKHLISFFFMRFSSGSIFIVCSAAASLLSLVFFLAIGKRFSPEEYGTFGFLLAFYFAATIISGTLYNVSVRYASYFKAKSQDEKLKEFFVKILLLSSVLGLASFLGVMAAARYLGPIPTSAFVFLGLFILAYFIVNVFLAVLNGVQDFKTLGFYKMASALVLVPAGFLLIGQGIPGVLAALLASQLILVLPGLYSLRKILFYQSARAGNAGLSAYLAKGLVLSGLMACVMNMDVILVRFLFSPVEAGNYAAGSFLAKLPLFISGSFISIIFPKVAELDSNGEDTLPLLKDGLIYTAGVSLAISSAYLLFPSAISSLVFSRSYETTNLIFGQSVAIGLLSLSNLICMFYMAKGAFRSIPLLLITLVLQTGLMAYFNSELASIIIIMNAVSAILLAALVAVHLEDIRALLKNRKGYRPVSFVNMWLKLEHKKH
jgi:O-antigen/teichoic acid export membrane protein